ncbi:rapid alkalinization factor-like [Oryza brachyantha]|uniref:rapid alkalinization factor-like n=1 Tax=Oryza brachyantha TaxID=4533 RepID=UPI001ADA48C7|nr:rapid alkalinization factor-like [Oryza brachyantha]
MARGGGFLSANVLLVAAALLLLALAWGARAAGAGDVPLSWELGVVGGGGEEEEDSFGFSTAGEAAVVRRVLQGQGYISYGALRRDTTPCSVRGASYYNCHPGGQANPYSRGCSAITRCRG